MQFQAGTVLALPGSAVLYFLREQSNDLVHPLSAQDLIGIYHFSAASMLITGGTNLGRSQLTVLAPCIQGWMLAQLLTGRASLSEW